MKNTEDKSKKINTNKLLRWSGTILTLILFFYILQQQDWNTIWQTFQQLSSQVILIVWILFAIRVLINSVRWFIILRIANINIPFIESLKLFYLGMFISNFLPSTIGGDGIRFFALLKYEKDKSIALSSIIGDRLVNMAAMIFMLPISFVVFFEHLVLLGNSRLIGAFFLPGLRKKIITLQSAIKEVIKKNQFWLKSPRELFSSVVVSWIAQLIYFLGLWLIASNLGMSIKFGQVIGISVIAYFIALLPISINGYGLREITITSLYSLLGYPIEAAISLAIASRLIYLSTTLFGAIWLPKHLSFLDKKIPEL